MGIGRRQDEKVTEEKKEMDWMEEDRWGQIQGAREGDRKGRKKRRNSGKKERGKERGRKVIMNSPLPFWKMTIPTTTQSNSHLKQHHQNSHHAVK